MKKNVSPKVKEWKLLIEGMGGDIDFVDDNIISADGGLWQVLVEEERPNELCVSFHVNTDPATAANIVKRLSELGSNMGMEIVVQECYAFEFNQDGSISGMTFGKDAYKTVGREPFDIFRPFQTPGSSKRET